MNTASPARAVLTNQSDATRRVEHFSRAAQLLWPAVPDLAQYYLYVQIMDNIH